MTYRIQTFQRGAWRPAWHSIIGLARALEMQQELEYQAGLASRVMHRVEHRHETRHYRVLTRHPTGWQDGVHEFRCSTTRSTSDDTGVLPLVWYAVAPKFGCSKNYMTPEGAIRAMCAEHACTVLRLERIAESSP
jgi:hypothetical protein